MLREITKLLDKMIDVQQREGHLFKAAYEKVMADSEHDPRDLLYAYFQELVERRNRRGQPINNPDQLGLEVYPHARLSAFENGLGADGELIPSGSSTLADGRRMARRNYQNSKTKMQNDLTILRHYEFAIDRLGESFDMIEGLKLVEEHWSLILTGAEDAD